MYIGYEHEGHVSSRLVIVSRVGVDHSAKREATLLLARILHPLANVLIFRKVTLWQADKPRLYGKVADYLPTVGKSRADPRGSFRENSDSQQHGSDAQKQTLSVAG